MSRLVVVLCVFMSLVATACGGGSTPSSETPTATATTPAPVASAVSGRPTVAPTPLAEPPTATAVPPTATAAPPTPVPPPPPPAATDRPAEAATPPPPPAPPPPSSNSVTVRAFALAFNRNLISVAAGSPTTLVLQNDDVGIPHDIGVAGKGESDVCTGPCNRSFTVTLSAGTYQFLCTVHPTLMFGTLVAR